MSKETDIKNEDQDSLRLDLENLGDIIDNNLDMIIMYIKDNYPDIDIFNKFRYTDPIVVKKVIEESQKANPGLKLFYVDVPYYGVIVYRQQTLKDAREVAEEGITYSEELIKDNGGVDKINGLPENEKRVIHQRITDQTNDYMSNSTVKKCVVFPDNFSEQVDTETLPYGILPMLVDIIITSSGFQEVNIQEI